MILVDTHVLIWLGTDDPALGVRARRLLLEASAVYYSPISVAELAIKGMLDRLSPVIASLNGADFDAAGLRELPLTARQAEAITRLPELVRHDPFDRFIAAQALAEGLVLLTADRVLLSSGWSWVRDARA